MNCDPLVSVVIPAYNSARYIGETLDSVLAQTYLSVEVIVVDDGSTDDTLGNLREYPSVKVLTQPNSGPSRARNAGIRESQGEFIAFLDTDDLWLPEKLVDQVAILRAFPEAGLVFADMRLFSTERDKETSMFLKYGLSLSFFGHEQLVLNSVSKLVRMNFIPTSSVVARKECLIQAGCFDENFWKAEDWDLWLRIALRFPIAYSPKLLMLKRLHEDNASSDAEGMNVAALRVLEKLERENGEMLLQNGIDMVCLLRDGYRNLGYFYLREFSKLQARAALKKSLILGVQMRSLLYFVSTFLSPGLLRSIMHARG